MVEVPVDQQIGDAGLLLHTRRQRRKGRRDRAEIEDQVGPRLEHHLHIGGVAAPRQPAELGQVAGAGTDEFALIEPRRARPAHHQIGRQHVKGHRGGRPRRHDALDTVGDLDAPPGGVPGLAPRRSGGQQAHDHQYKGMPSDHECPAAKASMPRICVMIPRISARDRAARLR